MADSDVTDWVRKLTAMGLPEADIARACGVSPGGAQDWTADAAIALEDLQTVAFLLLERIPAQRVVAWLTERDPQTRRRLLDEIAAAPTDVLAAALAAAPLAPSQSSSED